MLLWPSQSWTKRRSAPASSRWVAIECFRQWKWRFALGSLGRFLGTSSSEAGIALRSLVQPIIEHSAEDEVVCIVPHGLLHPLPFHALPTSEGFLGFRNPVCYLPSASALPVCRRATRLGSNPVVVAG